jgi:hypothetical protein
LIIQNLEEPHFRKAGMSGLHSGHRKEVNHENTRQPVADDILFLSSITDSCGLEDSGQTETMDMGIID